SWSSCPSWFVSAVALVAVLAMAACGGSNVAPPTGATPIPQTEVFSGLINTNGGFTHPFTSQAGGTVTATLTSVSPGVVVGVSLGTWNGVACQIVIANDNAVVNTVV